MSTPRCTGPGRNRTGCDEPAPNAAICTTCERELAAALRGIPGPDGLAHHLGLSLTRQAVTGDHGPSRGGATPLPYDERVARVMAHLHGVMASWIRDLTEGT